MFDDCIIMAGGLGTRLWPASSSRLPKQFLPGPGGKSFFRAAVDRGLAVSGRIIIIAGKAHVRHVLEACDSLSGSEKARLVLIGEPLARNTAPAIACGAVFAERTAGRGRKMLVLTSDHVIGPLEAFRADAEKAAALAAGAAPGAAPAMVVFGIAPGRPETGYGYIEAGGGALPLGGALSEGGCFRALSFREKPDRETAEKFLAAGNFYWNSGMFAFDSSFILDEFRKNEPEVLAPFEKLPVPGEGAYAARGGIAALENWPGLEAAYGAARAVSIDYAVAEKCRSVIMVRAGFDWFDVGSWDEYARLPAVQGKKDADVFGADTASSCFVDADIPVALCGTEDLIVVIRSGRDGGPASALIAKKGETQRLKAIVEQIKAAGRTELL
ncbi:MAG: mannose-1-phosphate guanylyltransferase [Spirochaetaceae bacterium]|jgi:mannose-1-phosphate guanylyltransferase/mannose-1-phosphate guanylyltransferase/mannose-6-phosphate isomerase|nr:mannose-1-phosphate guanylyltransferase [Spirochaetaceae bacterium]